MAGHSQFKNIMYRKGAQDAKRAKVFSKISREITVAVKEGGADPESNSRLRSALINARAENMPNDNVERAIKKAIAAGARTVIEVKKITGAGNGSCHGRRCTPKIQEILDSELAKLNDK